MPPFLMAGARFLISGAVLYAIARAAGAERPRLVHWGRCVLVGCLGFVRTFAYCRTFISRLTCNV